jgi:hypothetical protein
VAEAPTSFKDGIGKFNPKLFNVYEKNNQKKMAVSMSNFNMARRNRKSMMTSSGFSKKLSVEKEPLNEYIDIHSKKMFNV